MGWAMLVYAPKRFQASRYWSDACSKLSFSAAKNLKIPGENGSTWTSLEKTQTARLFCIFVSPPALFLSYRSRLPWTGSDCTWQIRPRPIDCDSGTETPVKIFYVVLFGNAHFFLWLRRYLGTIYAPQEVHAIAGCYTSKCSFFAR